MGLRVLSRTYSNVSEDSVAIGWLKKLGLDCLLWDNERVSQVHRV